MTSSPIIFLLLLIFSSHILSAKILVVLPSLGYSQFILVDSLITALAERGHSLTVISAHPPKTTDNVTSILVELQKDQPPEQLFHLQELSIFENIVGLHELGLARTEDLLRNLQVQTLLRRERGDFDLVVVETFFNEAHHAFAAHFTAPKILFHSMAVNEWNSHMVANPLLPSYSPTSFAGYTTRMAFLDRFRNSVALWFDRGYKYWVNYPAQERLMRKYFPEVNLSLDDVISETSLMLSCSHVSTAEATPLTPSVIEVGGLHIRNVTRLPESVKRFLDSAEKGAIYFSLGTNLHSSSLSEDLIDDLLTAIGKLEQKVLWKFERCQDIVPEKKPDNLMVSEWFDQTDILAHPNTILFISHCGMGSTTEAIYYGIPVIGIPVYGDQAMNTRRLVEFGMGMEVALQHLSGQVLSDAVYTIVNNTEYLKNAQKRSKIMRDRPMAPLDSAVYWTEYVLRHEGAHFLKNSIYHLNWFQLYCLDVIGTIVGGVIVCVYTLFLVTKYLWKVRTAMVDSKRKKD